jgi:hypothetical protein
VRTNDGAREVPLYEVKDILPTLPDLGSFAHLLAHSLDKTN